MPLEIKSSSEFFEKEKNIKEYWDKNQKIIESLLENIETRLGEGITSLVHFPETNENICLKVFKSLQELSKVQFYLPVEREMKFLAELQDIRSEVKIPKPYLSANYENDKGVKFLMMERIHGQNIKKILEGAGKLPKNFKVEEFRQKMKDFLDKMHEANIYHRDLHEGNVMLTEEGEIFVIDFGSATKSFGEDAYEENLGGKGAVKFTPDEDNLRQICIRLTPHLLTNKE